MWRGEFIEVADDGRRWAWWACCRCGRELLDGDSVGRGFGPDCWRQLRRNPQGHVVAAALRRSARAQDREAYRRWRVWDRNRRELGLIAAGREAVRLEGVQGEQLRFGDAGARH